MSKNAITKGIKMTDCKFYIDRDARTIVCVYDQARNAVIEFMAKKMDDIKGLMLVADKDWEKIKMPKVFKGKAVCAPEDLWDEELGKKIAFKKMVDKFYKSFFRHATTVVETTDYRLNQMVNIFGEFGEKISGYMDNIDADITARMTE